jgi:homoserine dehydrogenase
MLLQARDFTPKAHTTLVTDYSAILDDDSINCVVEVMGGVTAAKDVVFEAIKRGKHVVTANKALLAQYLPEIQQLLKEVGETALHGWLTAPHAPRPIALAQNPTVQFAYEAAVCGGIPIINSLQNDFYGDRIRKVRGIMNGTTNFMLSKMESEGAAYEAVLKEAQALGYAEADPTADVEGLDVQAKIALLTKVRYY